MRMTRIVFAATVSLAAGTALAPLAVAQTACPEGRTRDGRCVDPVLSQVMRQSTIIASQPKISDTSALNMPSEDSYYGVSPDRFEYSRFYGPNPISGPYAPNPRNLP